MTLAQRLLLAIGALSLATICALGVGVRQAFWNSEERRFREEFARALVPLERELADEVETLPSLVEPLCLHDPLIDSALVGLQAGDLDQRRLAISVRVPELARALRLDELYVLTSAGEVLGVEARGPQRTGASLAAFIAQARSARVRQASPLSVEYGCLHRAPDRKSLWVGAYAARHLEPLLARIGAAYDVSLSVSPPPPSPELMTATFDVRQLGGRPVTASRSRLPLLSAQTELDRTIAVIGVGTLLAALLLALLLSRSLSRPLVELAHEAGTVAHGEPKPVTVRGATEIRRTAEAFNRAIADLRALRTRLAATERIAARREIARRVAHEIKNPLSPIRAAVETLRRLHARRDPMFEEYFDEATRTVLDEVQRIAHIVAEFTRFARLPAPNPAPFDIVETLLALAKLHDGNGSRVTFEAADCPKVNADRDQVVQLMTNLIQNAQYAAEAHSNPEVRVVVGLRDAETVELTVSDNGRGVAKEMRARLFEPYATNKPGGTGLGLAIAQRIAIEHGGSIAYADGARGGAVFRVALPIAGPGLLREAPESGD